MADPGYIWVQSSSLYWTDNSGNIQSLTGNPTGDYATGAGYLWIQGTVLYYTDSTYAVRFFNASYVQAAGTGAGYIWIENSNPSSIGKICYTAYNAGIYNVYYAYIGASTATMSGTVTDIISNNPISGASVSITGTGGTFSTSTDGGGNYSMSGIPVGSYTATFTATNYFLYVQGVSLSAGTNTISPEMTPSTGSANLSGTVTDIITNIGLYGATVNLVYSAGTLTTSTYDSNGDYSFTSVPTGAVTITASFTGYYPFSANITLNSGGNSYSPEMTPL
jgi:Carboxypeptidase regulatory-like domain